MTMLRIAVAAGLGSSAVAHAGPTTALDRTFAALLQQEAEADARGDDVRYEHDTTTGFFAVDEKGEVQTRAEALAHRTAPAARQAVRAELNEVRLSERVTDVHAEIYGKTAVVRSRLVMALVLNGEPVAKQVRRTHIFARSGHGWSLAAKQETVIPLDPIPARIDFKLYDDYVGRYRLTSSRTYSITRDGNRLLLGGKRELVPENDDTFVIKGDQYRLIFVRNAQGAVTHLRVREFPGVEYSAVRLPPH